MVTAAIGSVNNKLNKHDTDLAVLISRYDFIKDSLTRIEEKLETNPMEQKDGN